MRKKRRPKIPVICSNICRAVREAELLGISYGEYMAMLYEERRRRFEPRRWENESCEKNKRA